MISSFFQDQRQGQITVQKVLLPFAFCLLLASCSGHEVGKKELSLTQTSFQNMPSWENDNQAQAVTSLKKSCAVIVKKKPDQEMRPRGIAGTYGDWVDLCDDISELPNNDVIIAREFFETWFTPYEVSSGKEKTGLFTGYYEPVLYGSYSETEEFNTPLYKRPDDLVMVDLGAFRDDLKGKRIAGRVINGKLKPFENRTDIEGGALKKDDLELIWVSDPVDAFFLHIQGSGRIKMTDSSIMRVGYAGQNGHAYFAIGRELIKRGILTKENVSLQTIREWLNNNPDEAASVMNMNESYVFFHQLKKKMDGPLGAQGVSLTAERSLAVDRTQIPYGVPVWLQADDPLEPEKQFEKLLIAQDTGGAIRGPIRGDVFWGYGTEAALKAGNMKSKGRYWLLIPKQVTPEKQIAEQHWIRHVVQVPKKAIAWLF